MEQIVHNAIDVEGLTKVFRIPERGQGLVESVKSFVNRRTRDIVAVDDVHLEVAPGEIVGFLGPNGAGKTTTLKMLSGLLHPTSGSVSVLGYTPQRRQREFLRQMTLVMGNRNQLQWDLPALDSFELNRAVYQIPHSQFVETRDSFIELLELQPLIRKPVRQLSLGERMKVEIAASLLHRPRVLFLDEPTIGLDVTMQVRIRQFILEYNQLYGSTVLLTSHYMADIEALCKRVIVIDHGRILFDGLLSRLVDQFAQHKVINIVLEDPNVDLGEYGEVIQHDAERTRLKIPRAQAPQITSRLLSSHSVTDLAVEEPPIEDVIRDVFAGEVPAVEPVPA